MEISVGDLRLIVRAKRLGTKEWRSSTGKAARNVPFSSPKYFLLATRSLEACRGICGHLWPPACVGDLWFYSKGNCSMLFKVPNQTKPSPKVYPSNPVCLRIRFFIFQVQDRRTTRRLLTPRLVRSLTHDPCSRITNRFSML